MKIRDSPAEFNPEAIQNGVRLWQRHGALPHPSPLIDASNFQSREATLVVGLAHPMLLADLGVSPTCQLGHGDP